MITRLILTRIILAVVTLLIISVIIFTATEVLPGDIAARVLGREATEAAREAFRRRLNLDRPVYERYGIWLSGAVRGDFGLSLATERPVADAVYPRMKITLILAAYAFALYVPITLLLATISALTRDRAPDIVISILNLIGLASPEFVIGTLLIFGFSVKLDWFPVIPRIQRAENFAEVLHATTLPAVTLMIVMAVYTIRVLRDSLIEVLDSEYVRMATLKGLPRWRVMIYHALPNAAGPALNTMALNLAYLIGGVVVVEQVFIIQGLGSLLVDSVRLRDAPTIEAIVLIVSVIYISANLFADVASMLLNPRLRAG